MDRRNFLAGLIMLGGVGGAYKMGQEMEQARENLNMTEVREISESTKEGLPRGDTESLILEQLNSFRKNKGVPEVSSDELLKEAARKHSRDMFVRDFFAHENPDGEGPDDRVPCNAGENLFKAPIHVSVVGNSAEYSTLTADGRADATIDSWKHSSGHREIMLMPRWINVGIGVIEGDGEFFVTAMFC